MSEIQALHFIRPLWLLLLPLALLLMVVVSIFIIFIWPVMGMEVTGIRDVTPIPHNGCRPPKRRRV